MKKRGIIVLSTIFLITIVTAISLGVSASTEKSIATIGEYKISESTLKTYVILSSADCDQGDTIEQSVKMYAKAQIAADEISGTTYDISQNYKKELLRLEEKNFERDYEANIALCRQSGISREELIRAVVTSKFNILVEGRHFSLVIDRYMEHEKSLGIEREYTADELTKIYENYIDKRVDELEFVSVNNEKLKAISSAVSLSPATIRGTTYD